MELTHIPFDKLHIAAVNMRHGRKAPDISDILPSVRARGILQPLLVRPVNGGGDYEVIAGRRRWFCAKALADEGGEIAPLPCAVMASGEDADAIEASLIENVARLDPDEMTQYETFAKLITEGRSPAAIAESFGIPEQTVKRRLALGNLLPKIRDAYRREDIDPTTIRHLTLATKAQQKEWLALFHDEHKSEPRGEQLKHWLLGGQSVPTSVALFPLDQYPGETVSDLFGDERYFADPETFWQMQNAAIVAKREDYLAKGWTAVEVMEVGQRFQEWEHEKTPKKKGGKVVIAVTQRGEVTCHEGWLTRKEAARAQRSARGEADDAATGSGKPARPEVTSGLQSYIDLHRHAIVRTALLDRPGVALRLAVAHMIASSGHWRVAAEPQRATGEAIQASIDATASQAPFIACRHAVHALLGAPEDERPVVGGNGDAYTTASVFVRLLALSDVEVKHILTYAMAETLEAGSAVVEAVGSVLKVDTGAVWQPDACFFELLRDKEVANAMLAEVAGQTVADGNVAEKLKTQKQVIRDCLAGANGREKARDWLPGWLAFPVRSYTARGGFRTAAVWERVKDLFAAV